MSEDLYQIIYISTANDELTEDALLELLAASQKRNAARQITGLVLHSDGNIIQVMEGPKEAVLALYNKVASDTRHRGVTKMTSRAIQQRDFPDFKMGFRRAKRSEFKSQLPGFSDVVENRAVGEKQLSGLSRMVATFVRTFAKSTHIDQFGK